MNWLELAKALAPENILLAGMVVVLAIEIPMGAAVAGPFAVPQARLDALIHSVIRAERQRTSPSVVH